MAISGGALIVVYGGAIGSSKTLWCKDDTIYGKGTGGHPEPITVEMLQRNGFSPEEALIALIGLCVRNDVDANVSALLLQFASLKDWLSTADPDTEYQCSVSIPQFLSLVN